VSTVAALVIARPKSGTAPEPFGATPLSQFAPVPQLPPSADFQTAARPPALPEIVSVTRLLPASLAKA
jgi:hypothetical protein